MKKTMMALLLFISIEVFAQTDKYSFENLVGVWRNNSGVGLDVVDSNTIFIVNGNQRKPASAIVTGDGRNPLSIALSVKDSSKTIVLKGLLLFVNDNMIQWQIFDSETKPVSFLYNRNTEMLFLKRISELYN